MRLNLRVYLTSFAVCAVMAAPAVFAVSFENEQGTLYGSWDTTVSLGAGWRMEKRAPDLIGTINGGTKFSVNGDDGDLNFDRGIYSTALKITTEFELNYTPWNIGLFTRAFGFRDFELENTRRARTRLSEASLKRSGTDSDVLDAFLFYKFELGKLPAEFRIGEQVINWGESTFIQGGANVINHFNVSALRVPGAELREGLLPQDLAWFSVGLTPNTEIELVYQYDWDDTEPDAVGTFFSTNDFAPDGGTGVRLGFADTPDSPNPEFFSPRRAFNAIPRGPTREPADDDQYGAALRIFAPDFNNGTEFGFYYFKYHSRLPVISARTGSFAGLQVAAAIGADGGAADIATAAGTWLALNPGDVDGALQAGVDAANALVPLDAALGISDAAITGGNVSVVGTAYATDAFANTPSVEGNAFGTPAGQTAQYFTSYPEDIQMMAFSLNTTVGQFALQGEIAHHKDRPLQIDDLELLFAGLSPLRDPFAQFGQLGSFSFVPTSPQFNVDTPPLTEVVGFRRMDYTQADFALTRLFGPVMGADQGVLLFEAALNHVHRMPNKNVLRFDGPATVVSGNPNLAEFAHAGKPMEPADHFPDPNSYGYRLAGRLDFNNAVGPINMATRASWQHDVRGITPGPGGAFIEGRKALTLGVNFNYQNKWEFDTSFTTFHGAGRQNEIHDRDFIGASLKFTF
ncbi:MAG: DUF1302 domain-containing protein [Gammaproteobacteria bacterium]|nr:DUF1302 domain-containing protein [Gammaproteobacteria bacterium]